MKIEFECWQDDDYHDDYVYGKTHDFIFDSPPIHLHDSDYIYFMKCSRCGMMSTGSLINTNSKTYRATIDPYTCDEYILKQVIE